MKLDLQKGTGLERTLKVEIPAEVVGLALEKYYKEVQKSAHLKGFRPGKAPMQKIKTIYKDKVEQDVVGDLVREHYAKALDELKVDPVNYPTIDFDVLKEGEALKFSAAFEVRPEINLKKYTGLSVLKEKLEPNDKMIDSILHNLRESKAEFKPLLMDRPAEKGDAVVIDFVGRLGGVEFPGGAGKDQQLELGSGRFIPGFEEGVEGMILGATKTITVTFPENYGAKDLAGKPAEFEITLKEIKKKFLPELDDDFAKLVGDHRDLAHLREEIEKDVSAGEEKRVRDDLKNRILKSLVEANPIDVPKSMLADQKKMLIDDVHNKMEQQGMNHDEFEKYIQKWDSDFDKSADFIIRSSLLIDAISRKEDLVTKEEDLEARFQKYVTQTGMELEKIKAFYSKPENISRLRFQIMEEKVVDLLINKASIKEVSKDKLPKEDVENV